VTALASVAEEGDAVLTLGAGSVWQAGDRLLERLKSAAVEGAKE
jgi:UDP-N-acetylmuramate-alanine ligase